MEKLSLAVLERIQSAKSIVTITGAGISQESGIPTFRGEGGYWKTYRAEDLATPEAFRKNPSLVWEWYDYRREICKKAIPNEGHKTLVKLEAIVPNFFLITQNVDNLHNRASSKNYAEIHGNIFFSRCTKCQRIAPIEESHNNQDHLKYCTSCNGLLRPHIVWFGESYDSNLLDLCFHHLEKAEIVLVVGTSGAVSMPQAMASHAQNHGAFLVEINPEHSSMTGMMDIFLQGKAGEILPKLIA
ncbi:MAG: NAD-dependent deacylase [Leptospira sp.]|nr:NAD-dependent deacylase [Leptospira sp.]